MKIGMFAIRNVNREAYYYRKHEWVFLDGTPCGEEVTE